MTGAMYAAISGLKSHMQKLNVIGNNIANVNTYGYKSARTTFQESLYTTLTGGSNGTATVGGVNPSQIGYGCSLGTIDLDMSTKNYSPTGNGMDCMINGDGFFMVGNKPAMGADGKLATVEAKDLTLTRVGNFKFDSQGYLVDGQGNVVYGFVTQSGTTTAGVIADADKPTVSTQLVPIRLPMAAGIPADAAAGPAEGTALYPGVTAGELGVYPTVDAKGNALQSIQADSIQIDGATGKITAVNKADSKTVVVGYIAMASVSNPNGVSHISGPYYRAGEGAGECSAASIGGAVTGYLNNLAADAANAKSIKNTGKTELITGGLESSGTDLATEISEMITTQRGYQANTRIITVTDSMLEEMVNIKR